MTELEWHVVENGWVSYAKFMKLKVELVEKKKINCKKHSAIDKLMCDRIFAANWKTVALINVYSDEKFLFFFLIESTRKRSIGISIKLRRPYHYLSTHYPNRKKNEKSLGTMLRIKSHSMTSFFVACVCDPEAAIMIYEENKNSTILWILSFYFFISLFSNL